MATTDEQSSNDTTPRKLLVESADLVGQTSDEDDLVYIFNKSKKSQHSTQKLTSSTKNDWNYCSTELHDEDQHYSAWEFRTSHNYPHTPRRALVVADAIHTLPGMRRCLNRASAG